MTLSDVKDLIVIGGGITGLGVAREAAKAGLSVVLLERGALSGATSAQSHRIIHGGFRYLQSLDLPRVVESIAAQEAARREAPNLIRELPCIMPLSKWGLRSRFPATCAAALYSRIAHAMVGRHGGASLMSADRVDRDVEILRGRAPWGALLWYDALLRDPQKFAALLAHKIDRDGGVVMEHTLARQVVRRGEVFEVTFASSEGDLSLYARVVVDAAGPWVGSFSPRVAESGKVQWSRAFNVVLGRSLEEKFGVAVSSNEGRLYFVVPRERGSAIGTWYSPASGPDDVTIPEREIVRMLDEVSGAINGERLTLSDVNSVESGVIPVRSVRPTGVRFFGSSVVMDDAGLVSVLSTKYTTFQPTARKVLRLALPYLRRTLSTESPFGSKAL